jgi:hypothetical protein
VLDYSIAPAGWSGLTVKSLESKSALWRLSDSNDSVLSIVNQIPNLSKQKNTKIVDKWINRAKIDQTTIHLAAQ